MGVSFYSVALVYFPANSGRAGVAAVVYAVAGWSGSALGIGMAQNLHQVPGWFAAVAGVVVLGAMAGRRAWPAAAAVLLAWPGDIYADVTEELIRRGREVYIGEGCMHCHSQYVRPRVAADVEWWGPARDLPTALAGEPPLPGNRRQGPDLANVGNRRSAEWNRLHLVSPRTVSPGSRMPSYAHLFRGEESEGRALVAYLASLGMESLPTRLEQAARWRPAAGPPGDMERARRLFGQLCANCHGPSGRGDGVMATQLSVRPPDWPREGWRHARGTDDLDTALARIIKFGLPGSLMAGHEYLPDADVAGLARLVRELRREAGRSAQ
jgi:cytochrome c oxidase cbb3-type subunit 2